MFFQTALRSFLAVTGMMFVLGQSIQADTLICDNGFCVLGPTDVVDDVLVLDGGILLMDGATVMGSVEVEQGGVVAASRTKIAGKVEAEFAMIIDLTLCDIGGKVELEQTGGSGDVFGLLPSVNIGACLIRGNLKVSRSDVNSITIQDNTIQGKLELSRNKSTLPIVVANNTVLRKKTRD